VACSLPRGQTRAFTAKTDTNLRPPCGHRRVAARSGRHCASAALVGLADVWSKWGRGERPRSSTDGWMSKQRSLLPALLTTREAAAALGVHERTLRRYMSSGLLAYRRLPGGHYRIPAESIRDLWAGDDSSNPDRRRGPQGTGGPSADASGSGGTRVRRSRRRLHDEGADSYDLSPETLAALRARTVGDG
jgi:excisionase family DNA binding protein